MYSIQKYYVIIIIHDMNMNIILDFLYTLSQNMVSELESNNKAQIVDKIVLQALKVVYNIFDILFI